MNITNELKQSNNLQEASSHKRRRVAPIDDNGYTEITIGVLGNVDSTKSSLVGTLVSGILDDGNGLSRSVVFVHPHERATGRTSDISYQYLKDENSKRIFTFVDLAGHEAYLKTTVAGLTTNLPDLALICISDKITRMTKEHLGLCIAMDIPFMILFTKIDLIPEVITDSLINDIRKISTMLRKKMFQIKEEKDLDVVVKQPNMYFPYTKVSNKSGFGLDIVKKAINIYPKRKRNFMNGFVVEHIFNVQGHGTVVSGYSGIDINKGSNLYLGPFNSGSFISVKIKSIHNDYRFDVDKLNKEKRGCLSISLNSQDRQYLRKGMVLLNTPPANICKMFKASVKILHHHTTIKPGYQAYANCGMIRESVKFKSIYSKDGQELTCIKSGDEVIIDIEFMSHMNYIEPGQKIVFREHTTRAIGNIISIIN
jgi:GTPase